MIILFRKIQKRQIVAFVPWPLIRGVKSMTLKNQEIKKPKINKKKVPTFLTRGIALKLKNTQFINNILIFVFVTFSFCHNRNKDKGIEKVKETKPENFYYSINMRPVKAAQTKKNTIETFHHSFLKTKCFFKILQKCTNPILKKNTSLIREAYPFVFEGLKGASTISGFKKVLYNKVLVQDRRLKSMYNRRKHKITYYMVTHNQSARLDKTFFYLGKNKLSSMIGLALKVAYYVICHPLSFSKKATINGYFNRKRLIRPRIIPHLVSIIEGQITVLLWRNQFSNSLTKSRQKHSQGVSQECGIFCKNNNTVVLKE